MEHHFPTLLSLVIFIISHRVKSIQSLDQFSLPFLVRKLLQVVPVKINFWLRGATDINMENIFLVFNNNPHLLCSLRGCFSDFFTVGSARMAAWTFLYISSMLSASTPFLMYSLKWDWYFSGSSSVKVWNQFNRREIKSYKKGNEQNKLKEAWQSEFIPSCRQQHGHHRYTCGERQH